MQNVLLDYGLEGYGLYWYCIELIASKVDKDNITFELEHDARIIARNTGSTPQKVEEMMRYFVTIGLFESSAGIITCMKLAKRLDKSMTSNPVMRDIIHNIKSHDSVMTQSEEHMQDKIRLDKNKDIVPTTLVPKQKDTYPVEFNWLWDNKPDREGGNPKKQAYSACKARLKDGATWRDMAEGLNRYKSYCQTKGLTNTAMVQQMSTFFGTKESFKESWGVLIEQECIETQTPEQIAEIKRQNQLAEDAQMRRDLGL